MQLKDQKRAIELSFALYLTLFQKLRNRNHLITRCISCILTKIFGLKPYIISISVPFIYFATVCFYFLPKRKFCLAKVDYKVSLHCRRHLSLMLSQVINVFSLKIGQFYAFIFGIKLSIDSCKLNNIDVYYAFELINKFKSKQQKILNFFFG